MDWMKVFRTAEMSGATSSVWLWLILVFAIFIKSSSAEQINVNAVFGETATLPCRVSDGNKAINTLEWSKPELETEYVFIYPDIKPDLAKQHQSFKNRVHLQDRRMRNGNVSLILKSVTNAHAGIYEVRVSPGAKHRKKAHLDGDPICIINLSVVDPPVQTKTAESGKDVTLPCQAPHNNIIGVKWSKADLGEEYVYLNRRGQPQPQEQHPSFKNWVDLQDRQMKDGDVSLTLKNVTRNNTGTYECLVFEEETGSWKSLSIIYLSVDPPGQTGGHTEDGGKEDRGKEDGPYALATGLPVTAVLLVVAIFGGLLIYTRYGKQKHQDTNELEKLDSSSSPSLDSLDNGSQTCKETAVVVLI